MRTLLVVLLLLLPAVAGQDVPAALPEQIHLTLAGDGLIVHAATAAPYSGPAAPVLTWTGDASGSTTMGQVGFVENSPDRPVAGTYVYAATIPLQPGQRVDYSVGLPQGPTRSYSAAMPAADTLRFVSMGDIGVDNIGNDGNPAATASETPGAIAVRDLAIDQAADLMIIPGDLAYDNSQLGWDKFLRMQEPLQATVPTMASLGNHEWNDDYPEIGYGRFLENYVLPGNEEDYLFRAGPITFIAMNSDAICNGDRYRTSYGHEAEPCPVGEPDEARAARLEAMLTEADEDDTPWTVLFWHHPTYSWGRHGDDHGQQILWGPIIDAHDVDLVVTAHDHLYSRSHPTLAGEPTQTGDSYVQGPGAVYVVTGGGGRSLYNLPDPATEPPPAWHAAGAKLHHVTVVDATPDQLMVQAIALDGSVFDLFTIHASDGENKAPAEEAPAGLLLPVLLFAVALARRRT